MNATVLAEKIQSLLDDAGGPRIFFLEGGRVVSHPESALIGMINGNSRKAQIVALVQEAIDASQ